MNVRRELANEADEVGVAGIDPGIDPVEGRSMAVATTMAVGVVPAAAAQLLPGDGTTDVGVGGIPGRAVIE